MKGMVLSKQDKILEKCQKEFGYKIISQMLKHHMEHHYLKKKKNQQPGNNKAKLSSTKCQ